MLSATVSRTLWLLALTVVAGEEERPDCSGLDGTKIFYHTACKDFLGRAAGIVYMLEHMEVKFTCEPKDDAPTDTYPVFAVPNVLMPDGTFMSQTPLIMQTLGKRTGLSPEEGSAKDVHAMQATLNAADMLVDVRDGKPLMENPERMKKWIGVFEGQLKVEGDYLVGELSYADFATFWIINKRIAILSAEEQALFPLVTSWLERMKGVKGVTSATAKGWPVGY